MKAQPGAQATGERRERRKGRPEGKEKCGSGEEERGRGAGDGRSRAEEEGTGDWGGGGRRGRRRREDGLRVGPGARRARKAARLLYRHHHHPFPARPLLSPQTVTCPSGRCSLTGPVRRSPAAPARVPPAWGGEGGRRRRRRRRRRKGSRPRCARLVPGRQQRRPGEAESEGGSRGGGGCRWVSTPPRTPGARSAPRSHREARAWARLTFLSSPSSPSLPPHPARAARPGNPGSARLPAPPRRRHRPAAGKGRPSRAGGLAASTGGAASRAAAGLCCARSRAGNALPVSPSGGKRGRGGEGAGPAVCHFPPMAAGSAPLPGASSPSANKGRGR